MPTEEAPAALAGSAGMVRLLQVSMVVVTFTRGNIAAMPKTIVAGDGAGATLWSSISDSQTREARGFADAASGVCDGWISKGVSIRIDAKSRTAASSGQSVVTGSWILNS